MFKCEFYEVPSTKYVPNNFPKKKFEIKDPGVNVYLGTLEAQLGEADACTGTFKSAHPGKIQFINGGGPLANGRVCVKQVLERMPSGAIVRLKGRHELEKLSVECNCLIWASILLDLTYQFIARKIEKMPVGGQLSCPIPVIPTLRFTRSVIALVREPSMEKAFLVEEWIALDNNEHPFIKYLGNRFPESCVPPTASPEAHNIAEFLVFAQHVQWEKTGGLVFTSDYQGAGSILTDPQITSNPYVPLIFSS